MRKHKKVLACCVIAALVLTLAVTSRNVDAGMDVDPIVVVSLGDSYSSGEGLPPFGVKTSTDEKVNDLDWLAHRSEHSWPGMLWVPGPDVQGKLGKYRVRLKETGDNYVYDIDSQSIKYMQPCEWYFVAASGATTQNIIGTQEKTVVRPNEYIEVLPGENLSRSLPSQLSVFDYIHQKGETVDYVTMTIGGNDLGFSDIIQKAVLEPTCIKEYVTGMKMGMENALTGRLFDPNGIRVRLEDAARDFDESSSLYKEILEKMEDFSSDDPNKKYIRDKIKDVYTAIEKKCGSETVIIVAGYPALLDVMGKGWEFSQREAYWINNAAAWLDAELAALVYECQVEGMNIKYASVIEAFKGHEAYTETPYLIPIDYLANGEDLKTALWYYKEKDKVDLNINSAYSMHPNPAGAIAYAARVQDIIDGGQDDARPKENFGGR